MRVIALDTETPGFVKPLQPIEVAGCYSDSVMVDSAFGGHFEERYNPTVPIEFGALATHHILPKELTDKPHFDPLKFQVERMTGVTYAVGHNIDFDLEVLGVKGVKAICTLALSRYWLPDLDAHKLAALMYHMFGTHEETRNRLKGAHSALADIGMTLEWLHAALRRYAPISGANPVTNWGELYTLSELGRIPTRFTFGKYGPKDGKRGMKIRDFVKELPASKDFRSYMSWMRRDMGHDKYLMKALDNPR